ncbi:MAG TPA: hypothetical protein VFF49_11020 [Thermodesulfobacteriota bacterium]|nr:hypothetical protein [Thermodesulfobacteriota bacterium]
MKILKYFLFILAFLLVNLETPNAATILGKVAIYTSPGIKTYPLVSGNKVTYEYESLIKITGGTLIADKGTVLKALDEGEQIAFQVEKGSIYFRILPDKVRVSFKTQQGEVFSPKVALASNTLITGRIMVTDKDTIVEVGEGSLEALTSKGLTRINAGQKINLAQAEVVGAVPEELVGKTGTNETQCIPECAVQVEGKNFNGVIVDDNGQPIVDLKDNPLSPGTELAVKGVGADGTLLLQPVNKELIAGFFPAPAAGVAALGVGALTGGSMTTGAIIGSQEGGSKGGDEVVSQILPPQ